jgi:hypothetical protein
MTDEELVIRSTFPDFSDTVVEDIFYVADQAGIHPFLAASIAFRESGGDRTIFSSCVKWEDGVKPDGEPYRKCVEWVTCRGCGLGGVGWANHLDVGLWGLRDVVERVPANGKFAGWSWLRFYSSFKPNPKVGSRCALDRFCSREVFVLVSLYLQVAHMTDPCPGLPQEVAWLKGWNKCKSAEGHLLRVSGMRLRLGTLRVGRVVAKALLLGMWPPAGA